MLAPNPESDRKSTMELEIKSRPTHPDSESQEVQRAAGGIKCLKPAVQASAFLGPEFIVVEEQPDDLRQDLEALSDALIGPMTIKSRHLAALTAF